MKTQVNIGLVGCGVVGSGTLQLLRDHQDEVTSRVGASVNVAWVASRHRKKFRAIHRSVKQTRNWRDVVDDPSVDCVVELMGGTNPAKSIVLAALKAGKHVITANKAILSRYWNEIFFQASREKRLVYFEAAVGGGIPVIQALNEGLAGNEIHKIVGILNGTTNYILTQMQERGRSFKDALKKAQADGFAEANPAFDIEGVDAAQKISILGSLAAGKWVPPQMIHTEGIKGFDHLDIKLIQDRLKRTIKLLGIAEKKNHGWNFRVHPALVKNSSPFANVRNEYNAVSIQGNAVEDIMLYGKGAGRLPTASAVLSDIIFLARHIATGTAGLAPFVAHRPHRSLTFSPISKVRTRYYLRVNSTDKPGVLARIAGVLGRHNVSLSSVHQDIDEPQFNNRRGIPIVLVTHACLEENIQKSLKTINQLPSTQSKCVLLRME